MSRLTDLGIGILVGAVGLAGLSYLCSDDFKGFGSSDDYDDDEISIDSTENIDDSKEVDQEEVEYELEEESTESV